MPPRNSQKISSRINCLCQQTIVLTFENFYLTSARLSIHLANYSHTWARIEFSEDTAKFTNSQFAHPRGQKQTCEQFGQVTLPLKCCQQCTLMTCVANNAHTWQVYMDKLPCLSSVASQVLTHDKCCQQRSHMSLHYSVADHAHQSPHTKKWFIVSVFGETPDINSRNSSRLLKTIGLFCRM